MITTHSVKEENWRLVHELRHVFRDSSTSTESTPLCLQLWPTEGRSVPRQPILPYTVIYVLPVDRPSTPHSKAKRTERQTFGKWPTLRSETKGRLNVFRLVSRHMCLRRPVCNDADGSSGCTSLTGPWDKGPTNRPKGVYLTPFCVTTTRLKMSWCNNRGLVKLVSFLSHRKNWEWMSTKGNLDELSLPRQRVLRPYGKPNPLPKKQTKTVPLSDPSIYNLNLLKIKFWFYVFWNLQTKGKGKTSINPERNGHWYFHGGSRTKRVDYPQVSPIGLQLCLFHESSLQTLVDAVRKV